MNGYWAIPVLFGILFFSTIFGVQDVYGPHYTTFDGWGFDFSGFFGGGLFMTYDISQGLANPIKKADFEVCITRTVTDTVIPTEILQLELVSCRPITISPDDSDQKNFLLAIATQLSPPNFSSISSQVDVSGFYEIVNPAGKSMAGKTEFDITGIDVNPPPLCNQMCFDVFLDCIDTGSPLCHGELESCRLTCGPP